MDRTKVEESIAELAASTGMTTKTIRIGDMSIVLGIGARKTTTTTTRQEQGGIDEELDEILSTPAPVKGEALLGHLKTFEKIARRTSIASARLGSDITRTVARRSLGDELDRAILRCAQERYESERTLHAALVKQLDLLDPQPLPRVLLESITLDQVMAMLAKVREAS